MALYRKIENRWEMDMKSFNQKKQKEQKERSKPIDTSAPPPTETRIKTRSSSKSEQK